MNNAPELNNDFYESVRHHRNAQRESGSPQVNSRVALAYHMKDSLRSQHQQQANIDIQSNQLRQVWNHCDSVNSS